MSRLFCYFKVLNRRAYKCVTCCKGCKEIKKCKGYCIATCLDICDMAMDELTYFALKLNPEGFYFNTFRRDKE